MTFSTSKQGNTISTSSIKATPYFEQCKIEHPSNLSLYERVRRFSSYAWEWEKGVHRTRKDIAGLELEYMDPYLRRTYFHDAITDEKNRQFFHNYLCEFVIPCCCDPAWHLPIVRYLERDGCDFDIQERLLADTQEYRNEGLFEFSNELTDYWGVRTI